VTNNPTSRTLRGSRNRDSTEPNKPGVGIVTNNPTSRTLRGRRNRDSAEPNKPGVGIETQLNQTNLE